MRIVRKFVSENSLFNKRIVRFVCQEACQQRKFISSFSPALAVTVAINPSKVRSL